MGGESGGNKALKGAPAGAAAGGGLWWLGVCVGGKVVELGFGRGRTERFGSEDGASTHWLLWGARGWDRMLRGVGERGCWREEGGRWWGK